MSVQKSKKAGLVLFASLLFGALGFVTTTAMTGSAPVAAFCENEVCDGQDCDEKNGWNCDEEPLCTHTECVVT